jgi:hypothetical protein
MPRLTTAILASAGSRAAVYCGHPMAVLEPPRQTTTAFASGPATSMVRRNGPPGGRDQPVPSGSGLAPVLAAENSPDSPASTGVDPASGKLREPAKSPGVDRSNVNPFADV